MKTPSYLFMGNTLAMFWVMSKCGKVSISKWANFMKFFIRSIIQTPFYLLELTFRSSKILRTEITSPPIFVIGHYRSGTTYLHKLLTCDKRWGGITGANFLFPFYSNKMLAIIQPIFQFFINAIQLKNPHFNNYIYNLSDPLEEDMITIGTFSPYSTFWGEVFPRNFNKILEEQLTLKDAAIKKNWQKTYMYLLKKITLKHGGKRLLLKNPPNTGRVELLVELFPDAKFVFIHRNPYDVYYSTYRLWKNLLEKDYALQRISEEEREENILFHYRFIMEKYLKEKGRVPADNLIEIRYDDLRNDPVREIKSIYKKLDLGAFEQVRPALDKLLSKEKDYTPFSYSYEQTTIDRINEEWGHLIEHWEYDKLNPEENTK